MNACVKCQNPISRDRIELFLELGKSIPDTCTDCSTEQRRIGFMGESGGKEGRKTGYELITVDPNSSGFKENLRRAIRVHKRAR